MFLRGKYFGKVLHQKRMRKVNMKLRTSEELRRLFEEANIKFNDT